MGSGNEKFVNFSCRSFKEYITQTESYVVLLEAGCVCWLSQHAGLSLESLHFLNVPLKMGFPGLYVVFPYSGRIESDFRLLSY